MAEETIKPLILVYFKGRGKLQPVRYLVHYLNLPYEEVHLNDSATKNSSEYVKNALRGKKIDSSSLPLLVHNGLFIYDTHPIMTYICRVFNGLDLLGRNIRQRARVNEITELIFMKMVNTQFDIFTMVDNSVKQTKDQINQARGLLYQKIMNESGYIKEICQYLQMQGKTDTFVFETITLVDFIFIETCHIVLGMFKEIQGKKLCAIQTFLKGIFCNQKQPQNPKHLSTMQNYLSFIYSQPFYKNNREILESFSMICTSFTPEREAAFRKLWCLSPDLIK